MSSAASPLERAVALQRAGQYAQAEAVCRQILASEPRHPGALFVAGHAALDSGKLALAAERLVAAASFGGPPIAAGVLESFQRAVARAPASADLQHWHGVVLHELGRIDEAIVAFRRSLAIAPGKPGTLYWLAKALMRRAVLDEAITAYREAARILGPGRGQASLLATIQSGLGFALMMHGEQEAAIQAFRRAVALAPDPGTMAQLVYYLQYLPGVDGAAILRTAKEWDRLHAARLGRHPPAHAHDRAPERRLRVGYVSADFREHAVASFLPPVFERHDRSDFEVFAYSNVAAPDEVTSRLRAHVDQWRDIAALPDDAAAARIREDRIDVLVDLTMHTGGSRLLVFARKPAPVQICWLAYPGTTGMRAMDYRVTDPHLDPPEDDGTSYPLAYVEKPLRLAETFWCYRPQVTPDVGPLRARAAGCVTFGSCNNFSKVHDGTLRLWARVLEGVPGSRCLLVVPSYAAQDRVRERFKALGVSADRLELVGRQRMLDYLANYGRIDIGLDTLPCGGGTTSLDALYMGVPIVTQVGGTAAGRAGATFARNLGMPELVASTDDEYVEIAVRLAGDLDRLEAMRGGLRDRLRASPLMDEARFVRGLEEGYRRAWRAWCAAP